MLAQLDRGILQTGVILDQRRPERVRTSASTTSSSGEEDSYVCTYVCTRAAIRSTGNETARVPDLIEATRKLAAPRPGRQRGSGDNSRPGDQSADHSRPSWLGYADQRALQGLPCAAHHPAAAGLGCRSPHPVGGVASIVIELFNHDKSAVNGRAPQAAQAITELSCRGRPCLGRGGCGGPVLGEEFIRDVTAGFDLGAACSGPDAQLRDAVRRGPAPALALPRAVPEPEPTASRMASGRVPED